MIDWKPIETFTRIATRDCHVLFWYPPHALRSGHQVLAPRYSSDGPATGSRQASHWAIINAPESVKVPAEGLHTPGAAK